jgi:AcrR family transcriptional regulator
MFFRSHPAIFVLRYGQRRKIMGRRGIPNIENKILNAVLKADAKEGLYGISTRDIAKKLAISEPVIFARFGSKKGLLEAAFAYAWGQIYEDFGVPRSLLASDEEEGLTIYQERTTNLLKKKLPVLYVFDYLVSPFNNLPFTEATMMNSYSLIQDYFHSLKPTLQKEDTLIIAKQLVFLSLTYLEDILRGRLVREERSDRIYYTLRRNGYLALVQSKML